MEQHLPNETGILYLIPTRLGEDIALEVLPISIKKIVEIVDHFVVEHEKTARRFIRKLSPRKSQSHLSINVINKYTDSAELPSYLEPCLVGKPVGILSEAGCPGIADPGAAVVRLAHEKGIKVVPLVGPSSIVLAMMSSGMNGQNFSFHGYLPIEKNERKAIIKKLERNSNQNHQAQIFIETPYRNNKMVEDLVTTLHPQTRLCMACNLTLVDEYIATKTINEWRKEKIDLHKQPAIFIIQKD